MPETIRDKKVFTLTEVANSIRKVISGRYKSAYWIKAEMNKLNLYRQSGHCYPDLVDKEEGKIRSQMRAIIWRDDYRMINRRFVEVLREPLKDGIKILFLARITFDAVYGLSLQIIDIDPSYTLGDLEKEKQECLIQLKNEGLIDQNKQHTLPLLPSRIAVISVETSKGYADFQRVIDSNPWNYRFFHMLFPAILQGDKAVYSIINQLQRINRVKQHFDLVAIIRGGGGDIGLTCYNNYMLAKAIALFPLPVLTGIGHATNQTVAEMVAFANEITPSKLAESLIQRFNDFAYRLSKMEEGIGRMALQTLQHINREFTHAIHLFKSHTTSLLFKHRSFLFEHTNAMKHQALSITRTEKEYLIRQEIKNLEKSSMVSMDIEHARLIQVQQMINKLSNSVIDTGSNNIVMMEKAVSRLHPVNVLKRGYSITRCDGKALKDAKNVKEGYILSTELFDGTVVSKALNSKT